MWRYECLKFKFEISEGDFDMFSYVFTRFRNKISNVWKICWRHSLELEIIHVIRYCVKLLFWQLLLCKFAGYNRSDTYDRYCSTFAIRVIVQLIVNTYNSPFD